MYYWIFLIPAFFFLLAIIGAVMQDKKETQRKAFNDYYNADKKVGRALNSNSRKYVKEAMDEFSSAYKKSEEHLGSSSRSLYMTDMQDLHDHLKGLEEEAWLKKAERYLVSFADNYETVTSGELDNFKDVELAMKAKRKCISSWQSYYAIDLSEYVTTIYPKRYFKEWMGTDYDPCMESRDALEKKLSESIQKLRPEYKRKKQLFTAIVDYVYSHPGIQRSILLKVSFSGATQEEIRHCYRELIKKNQLFERKDGNRFFVSLSEKELSKEKYKTKPAKEVSSGGVDDPTSDAGQLTIEDDLPASKEENGAEEQVAIVHKLLQDKNAAYIDKTDKGGSLYFFEKSIAELLKQEGYSVHYTKNGTKGTDGKAAWYIRAADLK